MKVLPLVAVTLKFMTEVALSILVLAQVGCGDAGESLPEDVPVERKFVEQFQEKVLRLTEQIDSSEDHVYRTAHKLFVEATSDAATESYEDLARIYIQAAKDVYFDIAEGAMGDEKANNRLDSRLRNFRAVAESAAATILHRHPESVDGWNLLVSIVIKYKKAAAAAERAMNGFDVSNATQRRQHRRYFLFKREMLAMAEVGICTIGTIYEGYRHRLSREQRNATIRDVEASLGTLPAEMAKDKVDDRSVKQ